MTISTERRGLGRGLGELFSRTEAPAPQPDAEPRPVSPAAETAAARDAVSSQGSIAPPAGPGAIPAGSSFAEVRLDAIAPNPRQPRTDFDADALAELTASIREVGLLQPVVVRPLGDHRFELVMGERRWRAAQAAGLDPIPAIVRNTEDHDLLRDALLENLHRAQLNPLEEAAAYAQMLEDFGCSQEELATRVRRSRPQISNTLRLLRLPPSVQRRIAAGVLSAGHARALLGVSDLAAQERLAQRIVAEGLSVRAVEELVVMGDTGRAPRRRGPAVPDPDAIELAGRLTDAFDTRVRVARGKTTEKISIEYALEDRERILQLLLVAS